MTNDEMVVRIAMLEGIVAELLKREAMREYARGGHVAGAELGGEVGRAVRGISSGLPEEIRERVIERMDLLLAIIDADLPKEAHTVPDSMKN